jgi:hypothetical protein
MATLDPGCTDVPPAAQSSAEFPALHGKIYRAMVIGSGGHAIGVRGILRTIKTETEHSGD